MRSVPFVMRGAFSAVLRVALEEIVLGVEVHGETRTFRVWKLLLFLPKMLLFRPARGGLVSRKQFEAQVRRFQPDRGFRIWTKVPCVLRKVGRTMSVRARKLLTDPERRPRCRSEEVISS